MIDKQDRVLFSHTAVFNVYLNLCKTISSYLHRMALVLLRQGLKA